MQSCNKKVLYILVIKKLITKYFKYLNIFCEFTLFYKL